MAEQPEELQQAKDTELPRWWCPECKEEKEWRCVTFSEHCADCGARVDIGEEARLVQILDNIAEDFVEVIANFYMTEENKHKTFELWQSLRKHLQLAKPHKEEVCPTCEGFGYLLDDDTGEPNPPVGGVRCPICEGSGESPVRGGLAGEIGYPCPACQCKSSPEKEIAQETHSPDKRRG